MAVISPPLATVVKTTQATKIYMQGKIPVPALRGIDLTINVGEFVAILGPSGSGKSTLLNLLGALDYPTGGQVLIDGKDITKMNQNQLAELRQRVGFVFQQFNLITRLTALENVELPLSIKEVSGKERRKMTETMLTEVGLADRMKHRPTELSGGQQQRVAIARAMINQPAYLLMDEPTGNVDSKTRDILMKLVVDLNQKKGITVILITHDPEVAKYAKRVIRLLDGLIASDSADIDAAKRFEIAQQQLTQNGGTP